MEGPPYIVFV